MLPTATIMLFTAPEASAQPSTLSTATSTAKRPDHTPLRLNDFLSDPTVPPPGSLVSRQEPTSGSSTGEEDRGSRGMQTYYFIFFALLICIAILCVYFVWRKRRNALRVQPNFRQGGYPRDVREWDTVRYRRRYWNTNNRNDQPSREEGLNENGEAPPPYMPKDDEEMGNNGAHTNGQSAPEVRHGQPAIPMQTLSRDQAGLKPPGYEQAVLPPNNNESSGSRPQ